METVKIVCEKTKDNDQGFIIINKSDMQKDQKIYDDEVKPKTEKKSK